MARPISVVRASLAWRCAATLLSTARYSTQPSRTQTPCYIADLLRAAACDQALVCTAVPIRVCRSVSLRSLEFAFIVCTISGFDGRHQAYCRHCRREGECLPIACPASAPPPVWSHGKRASNRFQSERQPCERARHRHPCFYPSAWWRLWSKQGRTHARARCGASLATRGGQQGDRHQREVAQRTRRRPHD